MRRTPWALIVTGACLVLLQVAAVWTLVTGAETLYLRDTLSVHLTTKAAQMQEVAAGRLPIVDPYRAGQSLAGNPNILPFYPTNLLYLLAPSLWALNAHFWIHWLLMPWAMYWLGRVWGLSRPASLIAGAAYAFSGLALSLMSFYNLVAGAALAPAFVAATLVAFGGPPRQRRWSEEVADENVDDGTASSRSAVMGPKIAAGLLWTLLLLAGEPLWASLALLMALAALVVDGVRRPVDGVGGVAVGLAAVLGYGTLIAAPQLVEFLRILPSSFRGAIGYTAADRTVSSWHPIQTLDWIVPGFFGRFDLGGPGGFWGHEYFTGYPPLFLTLAPGFVVVALLAAAGLRGRAQCWSWGMVGVGVFFALGRSNPIVLTLYELPMSAGMRYPVKFWLLVAVGTALLAGVGCQRAIVEREPGARRRLWAAFGSIGAVVGVIALALWLPDSGVAAGLAELLPEGHSEALVERQLGRWRTSALLAFAITVVGWGASTLRRRRALVGLVLVHAAGQLLLYGGATMPRDASGPYSEPPPILEAVSDSGLVVFGVVDRLFGTEPLRGGVYPDENGRWHLRHASRQLNPFMGVRWGVRYELWHSPEGLGDALVRFAAAVVRSVGDRPKLRLLRTWGVDTVLVNRSLDASVDELVELVERRVEFGAPVYAYRVRAAVPAIRMVGDAQVVDGAASAVEELLEPGFDPGRRTVLAGGGASRDGPPGKIEVSRFDSERVELTAISEEGGVVVMQRVHLPIYRATVDGEEVPVRVADLFRIGVEVPAGRHRVAIWIDRTPLVAALLLAPLGALGLVLLARRRTAVDRADGAG